MLPENCSSPFLCIYESPIITAAAVSGDKLEQTHLVHKSIWKLFSLRILIQRFFATFNN